MPKVRAALPPIRLVRAARAPHDLFSMLRSSAESFVSARSAFELAYAQANGAKEAALTATGRDALRFALEALDRPRARKLVLPSYADASLLEVAEAMGLEPVACDVRRSDGTLDPAHLGTLLDEGILAVVVIHLFGRPAQTRILDVAGSRGVPVIEDCAHAPLSPWPRDVPHPSVAQFTSLAPFKLVDCGGGGALVTDDPALARAVRERARAAPPIDVRTSVSRWLGGLAVDAATSPSAYDLIGHRVFGDLSTGGGALGFYKKHIRPILKRDADEAVEARRLPSAAFLRSGAKQLASLSARLTERRRLASSLHRELPDGAFLVPESLESSAEYFQVAIVRDPSREIARLTSLGVDAVPSPMDFWGDARKHPVGALLGHRAIQLPWFDGMTEGDVAKVRAALRDTVWMLHESS